MQYGCIGEHLKHSFSKEIHAAFADYDYEIREISPSALGDFLRTGDFCGVNVTIPYKEAVIPYLDGISEHAGKIGAVNTIVNRDGKLYGDNTDFSGMRTLLLQAGMRLSGKSVAILGTGGTSRTAIAVAQSLGAREIFRVSRSKKEGVLSYEELYAGAKDVQFLINTTPCGMYPQENEIPVDLGRLPALEGVADAVYHPLRTRLVLSAMARGIPATGGLAMLVAQAVFASEIFQNLTYPADTIQRVFRKIRNEKENIVLVGMPGSGKTTVGKRLAETMGKIFVDTDESVVRHAGTSITQIFARMGEEGFRNLESAVIDKEIAPLTGAVIATGGGAILREENVQALRRNGWLCFLDRPLCDLVPTANRPLAADAAAIRARYQERYGRYCHVANARVSVVGGPAAVCDDVRKEFEKRT